MPKRLTYTEQKRRSEMFANGFLWCASCEEFLEIKLFYRNRGKGQVTNFGYRHYCKHCENHKVRDKERSRRYYKKKNRDLMAKATDALGGKCQKCGYDKFASALEFHHVNPADKEHLPSTLLYSKGIKGAWAELDKCCLLCATCHKEYTAEEWDAVFKKRPEGGWTIEQVIPFNQNNRNCLKKIKSQVAQLPLIYREQPRPCQIRLFNYAD